MSMPDVEKVIKGLECCKIPFTKCHNGGCPYFENDGCKARLKGDALALLKAQEPRVMTLEELDRLREDDAVFVEIKPVRDLTCISVELVRFVEKAQDPNTWIELHTTDSAGLFMTRKTTDPNWRCWTSRPDEKRRKETPWN